MPELPEVETIKRGLLRLLPGKKVLSVECLDSQKSFPNSQADVNEFILGASVKTVTRRAKVLLVELSSGYTLVTHLKMTGQLIYTQNGPLPSLEISTKFPRRSLDAGPAARSAPPSRSSSTRLEAGAAPPRVTRADALSRRWGGGHPNDSFIRELPDNTTRVVLSFEGGAQLFFNDLRKFGWMKLYPTLEVPNIDFMRRVGPEPLEDAFGPEEFIPRVRRRNGTTIKAAILDQTVLAGVGNIYANESLWGAGVHPATRVRDVPDKKLAQLLAEIKKVMTLSIEKGGSTDKNYVDAEGNKGSYLAFANVFRREGQPCPRCGTTIEKTRVAGRGTHICSACQVLQ